MRIIFPILISLLFGISCYAQTEIRGKVVVRKSSEPVISGTVTLHPIGSSDILCFATTGVEGSFILKGTNLPDSVEIAVRSMISEPFRHRIKSNIGYLEIKVNEKATELKEVIVKAPKIRQLGDTINYTVGQFIDSTDKSIGDVLKKLPGLQVLSSGEILYQNKPISRFYIEGLDMLQGKYGVATNNIDASKIAAVQVLENHQPIKALKDMEMPTEAAINLKLKESSKGAFFATAQLGLGAPLWLYNNELVGMRFTRKQQQMVVLKNDNTGRDISQELTSFYDQSRDLGIDFLSVSSLSRPSINGQHYLFNRTNMVSLNNLAVLGKDKTLTASLNFLHDKQTQNGYSEQQVFLTGGEKIVIQEDAQNNMLRRELEGNLLWEVNEDDKYLHNKLKVIGKWNNEGSELLPSSSSRNNQKLNTPSLNISNDFSYILKQDNVHQYRFGAFVGYVNKPTSLTVSPSPIAGYFRDGLQIDSVMRQDVKYSHLTANAYFSGSYNKRVNFSYSLQPYTNIYRLKSAMYHCADELNIFVADSLQNQLLRDEFGTKLSTTFYFKFSPRFSANLSLPLDLFYVKKEDKHHGLNESQFYALFSPELYFTIGASSRTQLNISAGYNQSIGGITEDYMGYIMTNYRRLSHSGIMQSKNNTAYSDIFMMYRDPFTTLFASLNINYSHRWTNILRDIRYEGIFASEEGIYHPNVSNSFSSSLSLGKNIDAIRSDVKLSGGYSYLDGITLNQGEISKYNSNSWHITPSITAEVARWMIVKYWTSYSQYIQSLDHQNQPTIHSLRQNITVSIIPVKSLVLSVSFNHYYNSLLSDESKSVWFGNIGAKYKMKDVDIMLDWTNLLNTRQFVTSSYSNTMSNYSRYQLRPSELLLRVRFKLF